jgi:hypothetical protein
MKRLNTSVAKIFACRHDACEAAHTRTVKHYDTVNHTVNTVNHTVNNLVTYYRTGLLWSGWQQMQGIS